MGSGNSQPKPTPNITTTYLPVSSSQSKSDQGTKGAYHVGSSCDAEASLDSFVAFSTSNSNASPVLRNAEVGDGNKIPYGHPLQRRIMSAHNHPVLVHASLGAQAIPQVTQSAEVEQLESLNFTHPAPGRSALNQSTTTTASNRSRGPPVFVSQMGNDTESMAARIKRDATLATYNDDEDEDYEEVEGARQSVQLDVEEPLAVSLRPTTTPELKASVKPPYPLPFSPVHPMMSLSKNRALSLSKDTSLSRRTSSPTANHRPSSEWGLSASAIPLSANATSESVTPGQVAHRLSLSAAMVSISHQSSNSTRVAPTIQMLDWRRLQEGSSRHVRGVSDESATNRTTSSHSCSHANRGPSPLVPIGSARAAILSARGRRSADMDLQQQRKSGEGEGEGPLHLMSTTNSPPSVQEYSSNSKSNTPMGSVQGHLAYVLRTNAQTPTNAARIALGASLGGTPQSQLATSLTALQLTVNTMNDRLPVSGPLSLQTTPSVTSAATGGAGPMDSSSHPALATNNTSTGFPKYSRLPSPLSSAQNSLFPRPVTLPSLNNNGSRAPSGTSTSASPPTLSYVAISEGDRERLGRHSLRMPGEELSYDEGADGRCLTPVTIEQVLGSRPTSSPHTLHPMPPVLLPTSKYESIDRTAFFHRLTPKAAAAAAEKDPTLQPATGNTSVVFTNQAAPFDMPLPLPTPDAYDKPPTIGLRRVAKPVPVKQLDSTSTSESSKLTNEGSSLVIEGDFASDVVFGSARQLALPASPHFHRRAMSERSPLDTSAVYGTKKRSGKTFTSMSVSSSSTGSTLAGRHGSGIDSIAPVHAAAVAPNLRIRHLTTGLPAVLHATASNATNTYTSNGRDSHTSSAGTGTNLAHSGATAVPSTSYPEAAPSQLFEDFNGRQMPLAVDKGLIDLADCLDVSSDGEESLDDVHSCTNHAGTRHNLGTGRKKTRNSADSYASSRKKVGSKTSSIGNDHQASSPLELPH